MQPLYEMSEHVNHTLLCWPLSSCRCSEASIIFYLLSSIRIWFNTGAHRSRCLNGEVRICKQGLRSRRELGNKRARTTLQSCLESLILQNPLCFVCSLVVCAGGAGIRLRVWEASFRFFDAPTPEPFSHFMKLHSERFDSERSAATSEI